MPFIPHTEADVREMLDTIGVDSIADLFDEIPVALKQRADLSGLPSGISEMAMMARMNERAARDADVLCFAGCGSYDHHVPAAVWDLVSRGEFMTAYTPYQAEASQGTLQVIYEYQSMMAELTGMDVSNASVYDGGSGLGEAVLMAIRANRRVREPRVLLAGGLNPRYGAAARSIAGLQGIEFVEGPLDQGSGLGIRPDDCPDVAAVVIQYPNVFGGLDDVDAWTDWAHERGALVVAVCNPLALALLRPPGHWGSEGADIAVGDGQPLGIPMASGGPYFGFLCTRESLVRQMPGRLIGRTVDVDGRDGFTLTLQAREQHIRRAKATSNICTNQGLLVTAATIHMALLGAEGLRRVALHSHANTMALANALCGLDGVSRRFEHDCFHEVALTLPRRADAVVELLAARRILPGVAMGDWFPGMDDVLVACATERRTAADIDTFRGTLADALGA